MKATRVFVFDLDGTLLNRQGQIPTSTWMKLSELIQKGYIVIIATGRPWRTTGPVLANLPISVAVCANGTLIYWPHEKKTVVHTFASERGVVEAVVHYSRQEELFKLYTCYGPVEGGPRPPKIAWHEREILDGPVSTALTGLKIPATVLRHTPDLLLVEEAASRLALITDPAEIPRIEAEIRALLGDGTPHPAYAYYREGVMEVLPAGRTKAAGLEEVRLELGFGRDEVLVFADGVNDLEMLLWASSPRQRVVMDHSPPAIQKVAQPTTVIAWDNGEGICRFLTKHFG